MKKKTHYQLILDKSGSMSDCIQTTISGFNEQMQAIQSLQQRFSDQEIRVGLSTFNHEIDQDFFGKEPDQVLPLTRENYVPSGSTALLDAIGTTVNLIQEQWQTELKDKNNTVVLVIITDGYENASRIHNLQQIRSMISQLEATEQWTFSFLGATLDAMEVARTMAIKSSNSMSFSKEHIGKDVFHNLTDSMEDYLDKKHRNLKTDEFLKKK